MTGAIVVAASILAFMAGVCVGAGAVEDGEAALPEGWWMLPGAVVGGALWAALLIWVS